ncbi:unnamed protein product, partial [Adineta steineri]
MEQIFKYLFPNRVRSATAQSHNIRLQKKLC